MSDPAHPAHREPLASRRARALDRIARDREEVSESWRVIAGTVRVRERGLLAIAQGLSVALRLGSAAATIWMAGRIRGPRLVRRGLMLMTAMRTAGRLFAHRRQARG